MLNKKLNIILLTDCLSTLQAGAEKQIFELARRLDKTRYDITVVCMESDGPCPAEIRNNLNCPYFALPVKRIYGLSGIRYGMQFYRQLKKKKADILLTYHFGSDIWGAFWGKLAGVKTIISNRRDMGFWRSFHHTWAYKLINPLVKKIVVVSAAVKDQVVREDGIPEDKIKIIYNGINYPITPDYRRINELKDNYHIAADDCVILHTANLKPIKGHIYLLEALAKIIPQYPKVKLLIIGEGPIRGELSALAFELKIQKNVIFTGKVPNALQILDIAHIGVLPSLSEGMSNALLEYMACAKPSVATFVGGNPELIQSGVEGYLVNKENVQELKEVLLKLILDPLLRKQMGDAATKKIEKNFTVDKMTQHYQDLFDSFYPTKNKVLHFISTGGFFGAEKVVLDLAYRQNQNGMTAIIGALIDPRQPDNELINRANALGIPTWETPVKSRFDLTAIKNLREYIKKEGIGLIHTHNYKSDIIGAISAREEKKKVIATVHGFTENSAAVSLYEAIDRWALSAWMHKIITVNNLLSKNFPRKKTTVIPNGITVTDNPSLTNIRQDIRKKFSINDSTCVIGTVGRLSVEKNQMLLLKGFKQLLHQFPELKLFLIGDGPEKNNLQAFIRREELHNSVILTGIVANPDDYYQAMDIFTLTSNTEGLPMTILEAMSHGLAVVTSNVGGIPDVIQNGMTGYLFPKNNLEEFINQCSALISDTSLRKMIGANAKRFVKTHYALEKTYAAYKKIYKEVLT